MDDADLDPILSRRDEWRREADELRARAASMLARATHIENLIVSADALSSSPRLAALPDPLPGMAYEPGSVVTKPIVPTSLPNGMVARVTGPTLPDLILAVMAEAPSKTWRSRDIFDRVQARGWKSSSENPQHQLQTSLARIARAGRVRRVSYGRYRLPSAAQEGANG
jgi:hypothetical protein